jgi:hypothetical protein
MQPKRGPVRLSADPNAPARLRELLRNGRQNVPTEADLQRLATRVEAAIVAGIPALNLTPIGRVGFTGLTSKFGIGVLAVVVGGSALWFVRHSAHIAPSKLALLPTISASAGAASDVFKPAETAALPSVDTTARKLETDGSVSSFNSSGHDNHSGKLSESVLLDMARSALATNPRRALILTQEHAMRFTNGALVQEREVIAIEALSRLGQAEAARARAQDFARNFPGSAHQPRIDQTTRGK